MIINPDMNLVKTPVDKVVLQMESDSNVGDIIQKKLVAPNSKIPINLLFAETTSSSVLFVGEYMEAFIPLTNLGRSTTIDGQNVTTMGFLALHIWNTQKQDYTTAKPDYVTRYLFPSTFTTCPSSISKRTIALEADTVEKQYLVLSYQPKSIFIKSLDLVATFDNVELFFDLTNGTFLPNIIRYDEITSLLLENSRVNKFDFKLNSVLFEITIAAQSRDSSDLSVEYRFVSHKPDSKMKMIKLIDIPTNTSTFTSFSFQNIDYAVTTSVKRHRNHENERISDIEEVIKY